MQILLGFVVFTFLEKLEESATLIPHSTMVAHFSWLQSLPLSNEFSFTYRHNLFDPVDNECWDPQLSTNFSKVLWIGNLAPNSDQAWGYLDELPPCAVWHVRSWGVRWKTAILEHHFIGVWMSPSFIEKERGGAEERK